MNVIVLILLLYIILLPRVALAGAAEGLLLWFYTVLPSLLPFIILSGILIHTDFISKLLTPFEKITARCTLVSPYGLYAIFLGFLCGYPMGSKIAADLCKSGKISRAEGEFLLSFTNNPSPVFLFTYVLHENLQREDLAFHSFLVIYLSAMGTAIIYAIITKHKKITGSSCALAICETENHTGNSSRDYSAKKAPKELPIGETIDASILNGFVTITKLGGYMILTSIMVSGFSRLPDWTVPVKQIFICTLELSTAIHQIHTWLLPLTQRYILTMMACAFGGCCIMLQTASVVGKSGLSMKSYLVGKMIQTSLAAILALLVCQII